MMGGSGGTGGQVASFGGAGLPQPSTMSTLPPHAKPADW